MKINNEKSKLSKSELNELVGGTVNETSSLPDEVLNKNGGNGCVCTYNNKSGVTNDNPAQTTCKCICDKK